MKWIKVAIGAVIAVISIGIIATNVYNMTQETTKEEVVIFDILTETTVTSGTFEILYNYANNIKVLLEVNNGYKFDGIVKLNKSKNNDYILFLDTEGSPFYIYDDDTFSDDDMIPTVEIGDEFKVTFEVPQPPQLTGISATLILLTPIIFTGGFLIYLFRKQNY